MKKGAFFWGTFFVSLGTSLLLFQQNLVHIDWHYLHEYWAVLLILWGILLLFRQGIFRLIFSVFIAAVLGFALASTLSSHGRQSWTSNGWSFEWHDENPSNSDCEDCDEDEPETIVDSTKSVAPPSVDSNSQHSQNNLPQRDSVHKPRPVY